MILGLGQVTALPYRLRSLSCVLILYVSSYQFLSFFHSRPVNSQRISRLERPPSTGFEFPTTSAQRSLEVLFPSHSSNFPRVDNLVDDSSPTTVEVRQRTIDLTRRVLSTRSADFDGFHSELLFPDVTQSGVPEETHNRPVCENLPEFDSDGKLLPDIAPSDSN